MYTIFTMKVVPSVLVSNQINGIARIIKCTLNLIINAILMTFFYLISCKYLSPETDVHFTLF